MQNAKRKVTGDIMKKLFIFMLCLMVCVMPCLAAEAGKTEDAASKRNQAETTKVATEVATTRNTTEKEDPSAKKGETTTVNVESTTKKAEPTTQKEEITKKSELTTQIVEPAIQEKPIEKEEVKIPVVPQEPETVDNSQPRLMVTDYEIENGFLSPDATKKLTITLKNMHSSKSVSNIKLSLSEDSDEIRPTGMGTKYISSIGAGNYYTWVVELKAVHTATVGEHKLSFSCEYEDENGSGYGANDIIRLEVRQPAELSFDGAKLPVKVVQDETVTLNINLMNTGKTVLYNCKVDFSIDGLDPGGSSFVGEIQPQQSATANANLLVASEKTGEVTGKITITYEDTFGNEYSQEHKVSTVIEKKVIKAEKKEEEEKKNPLWWLFLLGGLVVGGGLGFGIPFAINSRKQRLRDEERL